MWFSVHSQAEPPTSPKKQPLLSQFLSPQPAQVQELQSTITLATYLASALSRNTTANSAVNWIRGRAEFDHETSVAQLNAVATSTSKATTKDGRSLHAFAQQCLHLLGRLPDVAMEPERKPSVESEHFSTAFLPEYERQKRKGATHSAAAMSAAVSSVEHMLKQTKAFNYHKERVFKHAKANTKSRQGDIEPAATGVFGPHAVTKKVGGKVVESVPVMLLCGWSSKGPYPSGPLRPGV